MQVFSVILADWNLNLYRLKEANLCCHLGVITNVCTAIRQGVINQN